MQRAHPCKLAGVHLFLPVDHVVYDDAHHVKTLITLRVHLDNEKKMTILERPILLALWAVFFCVCRQTVGDRRARGGESALPSPASAPASPSGVGKEGNRGVSPPWSRHPADASVNPFSKSKNATLGNQENDNTTTPKLQEPTSQAIGDFSTDNSNTRTITVIPGRPGRTRGRAGWGVDTGEAAMCAYRMVEGGIGGQLCFRRAQTEFTCHHRDCRTVRSLEGSLAANILTNGSVLLQWTREDSSEQLRRKTKDMIADGREQEGDTRSRHGADTPPVRQGGFELSCFWNGSYTQFECAGVHLGSDCRDFLLSELHENVPYRICLHALSSAAVPSPGPAPPRRDLGDCVEFVVSPSGMQDIVIAMTTVGGAICVMLVIICLLVAYITENIMSPTMQQHGYAVTQRAHSTYHTHSFH